MSSKVYRTKAEIAEMLKEVRKKKQETEDVEKKAFYDGMAKALVWCSQTSLVYTDF